MESLSIGLLSSHLGFDDYYVCVYLVASWIYWKITLIAGCRSKKSVVFRVVVVLSVENT